MTDYVSNAKKNRDDKAKPAAKDVQRVVTGEVIVQKKSLGTKFRDLFIEADFKSVIRYVFSDVLLPAARNTIVDASTKGIERMMYGERAARRPPFGPGPRVTYNSPISRAYAEVPRPGTAMASPIPRSARYARSDFILASREEAALVLEQMNDIIDKYEVVSVADLNALVGYPTTHVDNKWGWVYLDDVQIRQVREGFLIDLMQPDPIQ